MKKYLFTLFCLCCFALLGHAQDEIVMEGDTTEVDSIKMEMEIGLIPESLDANVDSLLHSWHASYFSKQDDFCHDDEENVVFPDSVYRERLARIPSVIALPFNKTVRDCIDLYTERRRDLVRYILGMADFYFPIIESVLDEQGLPLELKYLAVVESALNPVAISRRGASGLWQFMLPTGKIYGLEINSLIDERLDPVKATEAACAYFKDMYEIYGDWNLVLAAYNCGPGNVNKAIRRSGGKTDFWKIYNYLPRETRTYVPLFVAANYVMNYYCEHNLCPMQTSLPLATDTVMINKPLHLQQVADVLHLDMETLRALNPQYKRDIVPGHIRSSVLKLPAAETYAFVDAEDTVYTHRLEELLATVSMEQPNGATPGGTSVRERITHVVQKGETLYSIANQYGVTLKDLRKWNGLSSSRIAAGKRLKLYVDNGGVAFASASSKSSANKSSAASEEGFSFYEVQSGDSLYTIAQKYPGVSASLIQEVNGLSNSRIHPGQVLKIPVS